MFLAYVYLYDMLLSNSIGGCGSVITIFMIYEYNVCVHVIQLQVSAYEFADEENDGSQELQINVTSTELKWKTNNGRSILKPDQSIMLSIVSVYPTGLTVDDESISDFTNWYESC